jgi:hypothetical protein
MPFINILSPCDNVTCAVLLQNDGFCEDCFTKRCKTQQKGGHIMIIFHNWPMIKEYKIQFIFCEKVEPFLLSRCKRQMQINSIKTPSSRFLLFFKTQQLTVPIFPHLSIISGFSFLEKVLRCGFFFYIHSSRNQH